jgi:hypothetical protein
MDHATLEALKRVHPGWRLLAADHAPMIVGFLYATFIQPNVRTVPQQELVARLDDWLYPLRQQSGSEAYPRTAALYLDTWADDQHAWLRKYYPPEGDEAWFDITPATEKAIRPASSLERRTRASERPMNARARRTNARNPPTNGPEGSSFYSEGCPLGTVVATRSFVGSPFHRRPTGEFVGRTDASAGRLLERPERSDEAVERSDDFEATRNPLAQRLRLLVGSSSASLQRSDAFVGRLLAFV